MFFNIIFFVEKDFRSLSFFVSQRPLLLGVRTLRSVFNFSLHFFSFLPEPLCVFTFVFVWVFVCVGKCARSSEALLWRRHTAEVVLETEAEG